MKKTIIVLLILLSVAISAPALSLWVGPNAYYAKAIVPDSVTKSNISDIKIDDLAFGAEARLYLGPIEGSVSAEYLGSKKILILTDAGLSLDILLFRLGLGLGPNFGITLDGGKAAMGGNLRATAEIKLGSIAAGLSWISLVEFNQSSIADAFNNPYGFLGATLTFKL